MKLKYYLRGLGIGIIVSTIVLTVSFCGRNTTPELTDAEIIARAMELGMVLPEESTEERMTEEGNDSLEGTGQQASDDAIVPSSDQTGNQPESEEQNVPDHTGRTPDSGEPYRLVIERGDVCRVVCEKLAENGVIEDAESLRTYLFEIGYASNMSIGTYDIPYGLTNEQVADVLMAGPIDEGEE